MMTQRSMLWTEQEHAKVCKVSDRASSSLPSLNPCSVVCVFVCVLGQTARVDFLIFPEFVFKLCFRMTPKNLVD